MILADYHYGIDIESCFDLILADYHYGIEQELALL